MRILLKNPMYNNFNFQHSLYRMLMYWRNQSKQAFIFILTAVILLSGCATTETTGWKKTSYGTWRFSVAEIRKLPGVALRNILSKVSLNDNAMLKVLVRAQKLDGIADVRKIADPKHILVADAHGNEVKLEIAKIIEIQTVRLIKIKPNRKAKGSVAGGTAEALSYVPVVPLAITTWPLLKALGLDAGKNAADNGKALMAYGGMSKNDLLMYIGDPLEKYFCKSKYGGHEVWIYRQDQVLRGGRALFISVKDKKVYHASYNTTFFKKSGDCSALRR